MVKAFHLVYRYNFHNRLKGYYNLIYSIWIQLELKEAKNTYFHSPFKLLGGNYISVGRKTSFGKYCVLTAWDKYEGELFMPKISIGKECSFGEYNHITSINKISIGNNVLTGRWVTITDNSHGKTDLISLKKPPIKRRLFSKGEVVIGDNVWIGDKVTILPGVHIGEGSIVAANAVVTKNIPAFSLVAGNPAKIIKTIKE